MHTTTPSPLTLDTRLTQALRSMVIVSPHEFTFRGHRVPVMPQTDVSGRPVSPQHAMLAALQAQLYGAAYNRPFDAAAPAPAVPAQFIDINNELSAANPGRERWDHGWQVFQSLPNGMIQAHKHGRSQMFLPGQYLAAGAAAPQAAVAVGAVVSVYLAKEMRNFQDGFYIALGEQVQPYYEQTSLVRLYWNIRPEGAVPIVRELVAAFNRFQVPFRFKCLAYPQLYDRFDAAVLFVGRRRWDITALLVPDIYQRLKNHIRPDVPSFTKRLAPGLALAEDPGSSDSFGTSRCRLLAEGVVAAYQRGLQTEGARLDEIAAAFARAGVSAAEPWLNPGSVDTYDLSID